MRVAVPLSLMAVLVVAFAVACGGSSTGGSPVGGEPQSGRIRVVTTIYPVSYFTERIGGDRVEVSRLVPDGAHAHDFEPRPSHISAIQAADLVVYTHPAFESWMAGALASVRSNVVAVEAVHLAAEPGGDGHGHGDEADAHVWLNPSEAAEMVERIRSALSEVDPDGASRYRENAEALVRELDRLGEEANASLSSCRLRVAVVSHEAYGHLLEVYEIRQVGLAGTDAEQEANPGTLAGIVDLMRSEGVRHILVEPVGSRRLAEQVASTVGAELLLLHPLESLTAEEVAAGDNYFTVMERNLAALRKALDCAG